MNAAILTRDSGPSRVAATARGGFWRAQTIRSIVEQAQRADAQRDGDDELAR